MNDKPLQVGEIGKIVVGARSNVPPSRAWVVGALAEIKAVHSGADDISDRSLADFYYNITTPGMPGTWGARRDEIRRITDPDADQSRETEKPIEADA